MTQTIFWASAVLLVYTYAGYSALIRVWAHLRSRGTHHPRPSEAPFERPVEPMVTLLIVAYNEAPRIRERLENILALDYPRDRLEVILASDGSADGTADVARAYLSKGVTVTAFETRRGKPAVLNDLIPKARGEIVVLADARQRFAPTVLRALVRPFVDPQVGGVSGELVLTDGEGSPTGAGVDLYWRYEKFIRRNESRVDSTIGATGAIYAIRRALFEPIPEDTILDDVLIPLRMTRHGYRVLFEPGAMAYDRAAGSAAEEFRRKVRTIAGNFQLFAREPWVLNPAVNRLWFQTASHKGLRLLAPLLLAAVFASNAMLLRETFYVSTMASQVLFYAAGAAGRALQQTRARSRLLAVPYVFCLLNWATIVAFARFVGGRQRVTWEKAGRGE